MLRKEELIDNFVIDNLKLVNFVIKKMNILNANDYEDYYQVGVIGLIHATKTYNNKFKGAFSTYAYACIKNEIIKYIKKNRSNYISLEDKIFNDIRIEDTIADNEELIIDKIIIKETYKKLYTLLNTILNDIEKKVIEMIFFNKLL